MRARCRTSSAAGRLLAVALPLAVGLLLAVAPPASARDASPATGWYPAAGAAWFLPADGAVKNTYSGGAGICGGIGLAWSRRFGAEVRLGWFRRPGSPDPRLAESATSRLIVMPFTAEFIVRAPVVLADGGARRVGAFAAAGPALVFSRERFGYRYAGDDRTASIEGHRSDAGGTASVGLEGPIGRTPVGWRLVLRAIIAGGHREVLRPGGRTDQRAGIATPSQGSLGLELTWR